MKKLLSILLVAVMVLSLWACGGEEETVDIPDTTAADVADDASFVDVKVGVCIYQFDDNFMTLFRSELENYLVSHGFAKENIRIVDGANDEAKQSGQIDSFIAEGVDVLIINPVNASLASSITDKVVAANIPLIYINREPADEEEQRWADNGWNVCYVGCDARQSGTMQGEIIADFGMDEVDFNGNGMIDYIMIEGDPENVDAQHRIEFSIAALEDAGFAVNCLDDQVGMWEQARGQELVQNALSQFGSDIEVVFCNNDAMALGALQAIQSAGRSVGKDIFLVGVDALPEVVQDVIDGTITGTVFNDYLSQAYDVTDAIINFAKGKTNAYYIGCDYVKVTSDNASEILEMIK